MIVKSKQRKQEYNNIKEHTVLILHHVLRYVILRQYNYFS